jgi:hypothetical protein
MDMKISTKQWSTRKRMVGKVKNTGVNGKIFARNVRRDKMGRLIDADELKKNIAKWLKPSSPDESEMVAVDDIAISVMMEIEEQPTAYDVDKVVEQLKECERYVYDAVSDEDNYVIDTEKAIEIVKGAVKDV